ncbi:MAG: polyphosphate:AMP phosphotransferase [Cephaloticoccus sp.]|nr:polyphosphate:AMP phosphotransferase [Cephaloticoccus sp.]
MLKPAASARKVSPARYDDALPKLRTNLLNAHFRLREQKFPLIIIVSGADGAGKGELVQRLNEWLDPRGVKTHAFWNPSDEERERPEYWRFWRALPPAGRMGILFGSWYTEPIIKRVMHKLKGRRFETALDRIVAFEKMLTDEGAVILKLWLHLPKPAQKTRLKKLEKEGRIAPDDWKHYKLYDRFTKVSGQALAHTDTATAPWHIIDASDRRHRELTAGRLLLNTLQARLKLAALPKVKTVTAADVVAAVPTAKAAPARKVSSVLGKVDLTQKLTAVEYEKQLAHEQVRLSKLAWAAYEKKRSMILVFEGWDAGGKGSAIRRLTQAMDPRLYNVVGIAAPTDEERAQHYLWRFWRHLPRAGMSTIFDRSWYGRVLVERVEHFATPAQWGRAYGEIAEFEAQLAEPGNMVHKFWIHISPEEQLRRFKERQTVAYKQYKITDEDWRNREKWPDYALAVDEMVEQTDVPTAPWTLVAGNDKKFARVQIVRTIAQRLEETL